MELSRLRRLVLLLICFSYPLGAFDQQATSRVLYLLQRDFTAQAIEAYQETYQECGTHDSELIQSIALSLLLEGYRTKDPETQLMTLFGAGISLNEKLLGLLEQALTCSVPELQLVALNFLARFQNDLADEALDKAMASDFLLIRLEAAHQLALKRYPSVVPQTEALIQKVPVQILPLFPQLFGMIGTADAIKVLRKMLLHSDNKVRIEAIRSVAKYGRDDLLRQVRTQATHHHPAQQEVCAQALGIMKDTHSLPQLEKFAKSNTMSIRLAALHALFDLGKKEVSEEIVTAAKNLDLFAITLLGSIPGSQEVLFELSSHSNVQVRINAAMALLDHQDPRCLPILCEVLIHSSRDLALSQMTTPGKTLVCYKVIPSATENLKDDALSYELSLNLREKILIKAADLAEDDFLKLAYTLFESHQNDLVPSIVQLLEQLQTPRAIELLKMSHQKAGAPLIRNYCNLALYRLREQGPYLENLKTWIAQQQTEELIRFRPIIPWELRDHSASYHITPEETSRLLVEAFETIAQMQEKESIDIILNAIRFGNTKNKYALAGLLIRAAQ